jgi:hypothetical protein
MNFPRFGFFFGPNCRIEQHLDSKLKFCIAEQIAGYRGGQVRASGITADAYPVARYI